MGSESNILEWVFRGSDFRGSKDDARKTEILGEPSL